MIKPNKFEIQTVEHFNPKNESLGFLNEHENVDLRRQIVEERAIGYYVVFEGEKILINSKGRLDDWPVGLFDTSEKLLCKLFKTQMKNKSSL